jgi:hypothetical protein
MIGGYARTSSLAQVAGPEAQQRDLAQPVARRYFANRYRQSPSAGDTINVSHQND